MLGPGSFSQAAAVSAEKICVLKIFIFFFFTYLSRGFLAVNFVFLGKKSVKLRLRGWATTAFSSNTITSLFIVIIIIVLFTRCRRDDMTHYSANADGYKCPSS